MHIDIEDGADDHQDPPRNGVLGPATSSQEGAKGNGMLALHQKSQLTESCNVCLQNLAWLELALNFKVGLEWQGWFAVPGHRPSSLAEEDVSSIEGKMSSASEHGGVDH